MAQDNNTTGIMPPGHIKRYHPHGFKEDSTCKYLQSKAPFKEKSYETEELIENQETEILESQAKEIESKIYNTFGVKCYYAKSDIALYSIFQGDIGTANMLSIFGKPVSLSQYVRAVTVFWEAATQIKAKHPTFKLQNPIFIAWDEFDTLKWHAHSTLDKRKPVVTSFIALGNLDRVKAQQPNTEAYDIVQHVVRHEIGHNLSTDLILALFHVMRYDLKGEAKEKFEKGILGLSYKRARVDEEEAIAEIFAKYTAPNYAKGSMPAGFENLAEAMLGNNKSNRGITMDKGISDKDLLKINPIYMMRVETFEDPPEGKISWYDQRLAKYIIFESGEDLVRYVLPIFQFKQPDIERILRAYPGREWNAWDVNWMVGSWIYLDKSIDQIIGEVNGSELRI